MASSQSYQGYQGYQGYPYVNPVVIDVPTVDSATASRWANLPRRPIGQAPGQNWTRPGPSGSGNSQNTPQPQEPRRPTPPKQDLDAVVYIELPEAGSEVSQSIDTPGSDQSEFVENTILYDPFENRRIDVPKDDSTSQHSSGTGRFSPPFRPDPPNTLNLGSPGSSGNSGPSSSSSRPTPVPGFMSKESQVYGGHGPDGFPISPIPISEFPEPPPAYSEEPPVREPQQTQTQPREDPPPPPRTQVILPSHNTSSPITDGIQDLDRKNFTCHHCGMRVNSLVIKENGFLTHFFAGFFFVLFMPLIVVVYLSDCFKYKNHYCPNCNRIIAYEVPFGGNKISYVIN